MKQIVKDRMSANVEGLVLLIGGAIIFGQVGHAQNAPEDTADITNAILTNRSTDCADYATTYTARVTDVQEQKAFTGAVEIIAQDDACTLQSNKIPFFFLRIRRGFFWTYALDATVTRFVSSIPASQF